MRTKNTFTSLEGFMMAKAKKGICFYSMKADKHLTALASIYNRKIQTERVVVVSSSKDKPIVNSITKVHIIA